MTTTDDYPPQWVCWLIVVALIGLAIALIPLVEGSEISRQDALEGFDYTKGQASE